MTRILHRLRHGSVGGLLLIICLGCASSWSAAAEQHPGADAFVDRMVEEYGLDADKVRAKLAAAEYKQSWQRQNTSRASSMPSPDRPRASRGMNTARFFSPAPALSTASDTGSNTPN